MSRKIGRPKSDKPKYLEVKARIDAETDRKLQNYCNANNVTRTEVVRQGIKKVIEKE